MSAGAQNDRAPMAENNVNSERAPEFSLFRNVFETDIVLVLLSFFTIFLVLKNRALERNGRINASFFAANSSRYQSSVRRSGYREEEYRDRPRSNKMVSWGQGGSPRSTDSRGSFNSDMMWNSCHTVPETDSVDPNYHIRNPGHGLHKFGSPSKLQVPDRDCDSVTTASPGGSPKSSMMSVSGSSAFTGSTRATSRRSNPSAHSHDSQESIERRNNKKMNDELLAAFAQGPDHALRLMTGWLQEDRDLNPANICAFIHRYGKAKQVLSLDLLKILTEKARKTEEWGLVSISGCLHGMHVHQDGPEIREFLNVIGDKLAVFNGTFNCQAMASSVYGLQKLGGSKEANRVLGYLARLISSSDIEFTAQAVSNAFYGLQLYTDCSDVRSMLLALADKTVRCTQPLTATEFAVGTFGLQCCGGTDEAKIALGALALQASKISTEFQSRDLPRVFGGLVQFDDCAETRALLSAITPKIRRTNDNSSPLPGHAIAASLSCLRKCGGSLEAREAVAALAERIANGTVDGVLGFSCQEAAIAVAGLAEVDPDCSEMQSVLKKFATQITSSRTVFPPMALPGAVKGLRGVKGKGTGSGQRKVMKAIATRLEARPEKDGENKKSRAAKKSSQIIDALALAKTAIELAEMSQSTERDELMAALAKMVTGPNNFPPMRYGAYDVKGERERKTMKPEDPKSFMAIAQSKVGALSSDNAKALLVALDERADYLAQNDDNASSNGSQSKKRR